MVCACLRSPSQCMMRPVRHQPSDLHLSCRSCGLRPASKCSCMTAEAGWGGGHRDKLGSLRRESLVRLCGLLGPSMQM